MSTSFRLFVQCGLGLEPLLGKELQAFGLEIRPTNGGVESRGTLQDLYRIALLSRVADSLRVRLKDFQAREFTTLTGEVRKLPFRAFLEVGAKVRVKVVCHKSKLWHSGAVQQRCEDVLRDHVGLVISQDEDAQVVHVRLDEDRIQISLEAAGRMYRRGYRTHVEQASLRETLAAALVLTAADLPHFVTAVIWDPFCGAGTIALEALQWARGVPPGANRQDAFVAWRNFQDSSFEELRLRCIEEGREHAPAPQLRVILSDQAPSALKAARANLESADLASQGELIDGEVPAVVDQIPLNASLLTNPPYGKRLKEGGAIEQLMAILQSRLDLRPVVALVGGAARNALPPDAPALFRTKNGGISVSARKLR